MITVKVLHAMPPAQLSLSDCAIGDIIRVRLSDTGSCICLVIGGSSTLVESYSHNEKTLVNLINSYGTRNLSLADGHTHLAAEPGGVLEIIGQLDIKEIN